MSDTRHLLDRISSFRAKLEEVPRLPSMADPATMVVQPRHVAQSLQQLAAAYPTAAVAEPPRLTGRAFRLLTEARELIGHQKKLTADALLTKPAELDALAKFHRGTVGL